MAQVVVNIPGVKLDKKGLSELQNDIRSVVRLRLARDSILKRLDEMLQNSELSDEDCMILGNEAKQNVADKWAQRGWM
jgi:hypothetical protein